MKSLSATQRQSSAQPAPKKLMLHKETLRRLTPSELRLAAGGVRTTNNNTSGSVSCNP